MNKSFLASSAVIIAAAALGYWIVDDSNAGSCRKCVSHAPVANQLDAPYEAPTSLPQREVCEFIELTHIFEDSAADAVDLQNLLDSVATEYLPPPRVVKEIPDWLASAGEEQSSPPDPLTLLLRSGYRLLAFKCAELIAKMEPLIGTEQFWSKMDEAGNSDTAANDAEN